MTCDHQWVHIDRAPKDFMFYQDVESNIYVCKCCQFEDWVPVDPLEDHSTGGWERAGRIAQELAEGRSDNR